MKGFVFLGLCLIPSIMLAQSKKDSANVQQIETVNFTKRLPVAKEIINVQKDLDPKNLGQDLPILLKSQTSVVATSDAGNGVGYTGFRIRGVGGNAINVMMNGVPYNDSENQGTYFVDVPDLASSASNIVIQRGVGTSSNGVSAFGASVNVISKNPEEQFSVKTDDSYGSFNTYKYGAEINSGKFWKNRLSVLGRYTTIHSDGYIDRASSNLNSYNFTALFEEKKTKIRLMAFGGKEKTYQAWYGIDKATWENNPKLNYAGAIYNADGNIMSYYNDQTDNYRQNHYQLLWQQNFNENWNLETTLHYTKGKGYYKEYVQGGAFADYSLPDFNDNGSVITNSDFIRKKWLNNDFYGFVSRLLGKFEKLDLNFGLVANQYFGRHFGDVSSVTYPQINDFEYYRNNALKNEVSGFAKAIFNLNQFEIFGDLQLRKIDYKTWTLQTGGDAGTEMKKNWLFFNPKFGVNYKITNGKIFVSYAHAHREPNRDNLVANPETQAEKLHDFEAGLEKHFGIFQLTANTYYMYYINQLVLSGQINNVGEFIRTNSGKSYRTGLELGALAKISEKLQLSGNLTLSENKNLDFKNETSSGIANLGNTAISFSPNFIGNFLINYKPTQNLGFGLQNQYITKQYLDNTHNNELILPNYFLTDFNAKYSLNFKKTDVDFKLLLNNIFNKKYVSNGFVWDTSPYYYSQAGINFMFGISLKIKNQD